MDKVLTLIKEGLIIRRFVLLWTMCMTWQTFKWAAEFAQSYQLGSGVEQASVIAAVTAPIAALLGYVFKVYADGRV